MRGRDDRPAEDRVRIATPATDELAIPGVHLVTLERYADDRGSVEEVFRDEWFPDAPPFVQGNLSRSKTGVLRGLHYHLRQADLWVPVAGEVTVGLVDVRPGSPAERGSLTLEAEPGVALYIPPGVAHGFAARTDFTLLYLVDRTYDGGADEHGFSAFDPAVGVAWPDPAPRLSSRDLDAPGIEEALASARPDPWRG